MILAKTRSTNPVMKAARGLLSREMSLYGGCARVVLLKVWRMRSESRVGRRRRVLVLRRGTSSGRPSRRRAVRHNTHRDPESGSAGPGTPRPGASGLALPWGHRTRIPLRSRVADEYNRAPTRTAGLHGRYAPAVGLASYNTQVTARHPSTSAGQRHAQHDITPGRPPPAPGFIVRIRSLSASQALR